MPEQSIPTTTQLPPAPAGTPLTEADLTGLAGWANFQRAVNVTLPGLLAQAEALLSAAIRTG